MAFVETGLLGRSSRSSLPLPIAAAFAVLALTAIAVAAYTVASGGLALALPPASPSGLVAGLAASPSPVARTAGPLQATASPTIAPAPTPTPTDIPMPTATPAPRASPSPIASPSPRRSPTTMADRFRGLDRCAGAEACYVYVVRSGDNLSAISNYFGSTLDEVLALNPQIEDPSAIHAGDEIHLPPP